MGRPLRIALISPHAAGLFGLSTRPFGGAETQAATLATALAARDDCEVSLVVESVLGRSRRIGRLNLVVIPDRLPALRRQLDREVRLSRRLPFVRPVRPKWTTLPKLAAIAAAKPLAKRWRGWIEAFPADVVVLFGVSRETADWCRRRERTVLHLISGQDVVPEWNDLGYVSPYGDPATVCRPLFADATCIVAQHELQRQAVREHFGREATIVTNPIDLEIWKPRQLPRTADVLWIGRSDTIYKRPRLALELAQRTPDLKWTMVMNLHVAEIDREIRERASGNVRILTSVPFAEMPALFASHGVFVTTGSKELEGLPNVLLQATAVGTPIVSLGAGDHVLSVTAGGIVDEDLDGAAAAIRRLSRGELGLIDLSAARQRLSDRYSAAAVADRLLDVLRQAAGGAPNPGDFWPNGRSLDGPPLG